jgi:cell division protein FtsB
VIDVAADITYILSTNQANCNRQFERLQPGLPEIRLSLIVTRVTLDPQEISAARLPRGPVGGYRAGPTEELLKRTAWEYGQLVHECAKRAETIDRLTQRTDELEAEVASLKAELGSHNDSDEVAHALLSSAQRAARELRESARSDGNAALKKARNRAKQIESEARRRSGASSVTATMQIKELREAVRVQLRETLESMIATGERGPKTTVRSRN